MEVTVTRNSQLVRVEFKDGGYVLGDGEGGLLESTASLNNDEAQDLLERAVKAGEGQHTL